MISALPAGPQTNSVFRDSPIPALRRLSVNEDEASVVLQGTVGSYYLKQLAQETIKPILGGRQLVNRVTVTAE